MKQIWKTDGKAWTRVGILQDQLLLMFLVPKVNQVFTKVPCQLLVIAFSR